MMANVTEVGMAYKPDFLLFPHENKESVFHDLEYFHNKLVFLLSGLICDRDANKEVMVHFKIRNLNHHQIL